tara:strand:- start:18296 stop:19930 length:1635 start_codon:yes stop_codon:yes gene_type:complete
MAGFTNRKGPLTTGNPLRKLLKDLSSLGMAYDDMVIRNSRAVGFTENQFGYSMNPSGSDSDDMYAAFTALSLTDTSLKKNISFFDKDYIGKRDQLRAYAVQDEIEEILDIISDEAIVYDQTNFMAYSKFNGFMSESIEEEIGDTYNEIYQYFGFNDANSVWDYFRKWLIDGFLAFEIIYNDKQSQIIGFKELDPTSLMPAVDNESSKKIWIQYKGGGAKERTLFDSQIIYISYSQINSPQRISYVERLIRSFNLLRVMEHSRIIWAVTNASFKTQFTIPMGGKSKTRAKQSLAQLMNSYREVVDFDFESGVIKTNGKPMMPFSKEYWLPSKDGETPEIQTIGGDGPDLGDTESLNYFSDKLKVASKIPFSRFDKEGGSGSYEMDASGMMRDEIKYSKFINRLRSIFQEILVKPTYLQTILNHPELKNDMSFKAGLGLEYVKDNVFEEMKEMELMTKRVDFIGNMKTQLSITDSEMNEIPFFELGFLIKRFGKFTRDDLLANDREKEKNRLEVEGYNGEDIEKILMGADKEKFKATPPPSIDDEI